MPIWDALTGRQPSAGQRQDDSSPQAAEPSEPSRPSLGRYPYNFDPSQLHPLAGLNKGSLDYLSMDDAAALSELPGAQSALPSRGWADDLSYGAGICYVTGLGIGGAWGLAEGLRKTAATPHFSSRLQLNTILNSATRRGPFLGNTAGVLAICYNGINSTLERYRGKHDAFNSVTAGVASGMIFKSTRGVRPMMISGGIVGTVATVWTLFRKVYLAK